MFAIIGNVYAVCNTAISYFVLFFFISLLYSWSNAASVTIISYTYEERSINSRTVLLSKHTVTAENQNYYEVVLPLLYITYHYHYY